MAILFFDLAKCSDSLQFIGNFAIFLDELELAADNRVESKFFSQGFEEDDSLLILRLDRFSLFWIVLPLGFKSFDEFGWVHVLGTDI